MNQKEMKKKGYNKVTMALESNFGAKRFAAANPMSIVLAVNQDYCRQEGLFDIVTAMVPGDRTDCLITGYDQEYSDLHEKVAYHGPEGQRRER